MCVEGLANNSHTLFRSAANFTDDRFLAGYHDLISRDDKIVFLSDAKQKVKKTRLNDDDIPSDAVDFYKFQKQRILQRHQIDSEIDLVCSRDMTSQ